MYKKVIEQPIGKVTEERFVGLKVDFIDLEWQDSRRRMQKVTSNQGKSFGLSLGKEMAERGWLQDDVVDRTNETVYVINILPSDTLSIPLKDFEHSIKIAYEIGNRHAPSFWSENYDEMIIEYTRPMEEMLEKLHARAYRSKRKLLNNYALSGITTGTGHTHTHGNDQSVVHKNF